MDPAWRTIPPIKSGSTVREAFTLRPDALSICASTCAKYDSVSSCAVVISTASTRCAAATSRVELVGELGDVSGAALLDQQAQEVDDELVVALGDLDEDVALHPRVDLGVREQRLQLVDLADGGAQVTELRRDRVERASALGRLEERACVHAVFESYDVLPSSTPKSSSASASSISRC